MAGEEIKNRHLFYIIPHFFLAKSKYSSYLCRKNLQKGGWLAKSYPENIGDQIMTDTKMNERRLPVGIQSFEEIRKGGYLYVDKTDIIWNLVQGEKV